MPGYRPEDAPRDAWRLWIYLGISLLVNWLFWTQGLQRLVEHTKHPAPQRLMAVRMLPPPTPVVEEQPRPPEDPQPLTPVAAALPKQIVDLPDMNDQPPADTRFLATRDSVVPEQTISPVVDKPVNAQRDGASQPKGLDAGEPDAVALQEQAVSAPSRAVPELKPSSLGMGPKRQEAQPPAPVRSDPPPQGLPSGTAPSVPFERLLEIAQGDRSAQDNKIQDVPAGDVTLLNAKSSPYADYIITRTRAAIRFMTINLPLTTWRFQDVEGFRNPLEVVALVAPNGEVTAVEVIHPSGSPKLDRVVSSSLRSGVTGHVPPEGAAQPDGLVRFVFVLHDGWVQAGIR